MWFLLLLTIRKTSSLANGQPHRHSANGWQFLSIATVSNEATDHLSLSGLRVSLNQGAPMLAAPALGLRDTP